MIAHKQFEVKLRLQVPGKVSSESRPSISANPNSLGGQSVNKFMVAYQLFKN